MITLSFQRAVSTVTRVGGEFCNILQGHRSSSCPAPKADPAASSLTNPAMQQEENLLFSSALSWGFLLLFK